MDTPVPASRFGHRAYNSRFAAGLRRIPCPWNARCGVYDKSGLADFARQLASLGVEIVSTGGTARFLREDGITVRDVSDLTDGPRCSAGG